MVHSIMYYFCGIWTHTGRTMVIIIVINGLSAFKPFIVPGVKDVPILYMNKTLRCLEDAECFFKYLFLPNLILTPHFKIDNGMRACMQ